MQITLHSVAMTKQMPNDIIKWLSDRKCRDSEEELKEKETRDRFFKYHANFKEEYAQLIDEYKRTGVISDKIIAFKITMLENKLPHHFLF